MKSRAIEQPITELSENYSEQGTVSKKNHPKAVMTDYMFVFGVFLAIFWAVDPFDARLDFISPIKHFPILLIAPAFVLAFVAGVLFRKRGDKISYVGSNYKLVLIVFLFGLFAAIGSFYAREVNNVDNGFLTMGLYAFTCPLTFWFVRQSKSPTMLVKWVLFAYLLWAFVGAAVQFSKLSIPGTFHAREHLVIGSLTLLYFLSNSNLARFLSLSTITVTAIAAQKNSAYMVMVFCLGYVFVTWAILHAKKIKDGFMKSMFWIRIFSISLILSMLMVGVYFGVKSTLPTGNPEYRLHTYEKAWNRFLDSPIWGTGFTGPATEKFDLFSVATVTQVLPTHSDPLDILAQGGVVGFIFWIFPSLMLLKYWPAFVLNSQSNERTDKTLIPYLHTFYCLTISGVIVCAFNPILNSPNLAWTYWIPVGMLLLMVKKPTDKRKIS